MLIIIPVSAPVSPTTPNKEISIEDDIVDEVLDEIDDEIGDQYSDPEVPEQSVCMCHCETFILCVSDSISPPSEYVSVRLYIPSNSPKTPQLQQIISMIYYRVCWMRSIINTKRRTCYRPSNLSMTFNRFSNSV